MVAMMSRGHGELFLPMPDAARKEITCRIDESLWEELHEEAHKRRVSKNQAISLALRLWLKKTPAALAPIRTDQFSTSQTKDLILERLDTLLQGQGTILKVLREITVESAQEKPIAPDTPVGAQSKQDAPVAHREALRSASKIAKAYSESPELPPSAKADRPRKQR